MPQPGKVQQEICVDSKDLVTSMEYTFAWYCSTLVSCLFLCFVLLLFGVFPPNRGLRSQRQKMTDLHSRKEEDEDDE